MYTVEDSTTAAVVQAFMAQPTWTDTEFAELELKMGRHEPVQLAAQVMKSLGVGLQEYVEAKAGLEAGGLEIIRVLHAPYSEAPLEERLQEEVRLMASIELGVSEHRPPLFNLGFGASGFAQKLRTLCHAIRLEHFRGAGLKAVILALVSSMQDYGAEPSIMLTRPVSYRELLPYFRPTPLSKIEKKINFD